MWHSKGKSSRLDYWLISEHLLNEMSLLDQNAHTNTRHHHYRQFRTKLQTQLSKKNLQLYNNTQYFETERAINETNNVIQQFIRDDSTSKISQHILI